MATANAKPATKAEKSNELVKCRVTKHGAGRISTGQRADAGYTVKVWRRVDEDGEAKDVEFEEASGDIMHDRGAEIELPRANAEALEARHFVEIL